MIFHWPKMGALQRWNYGQVIVVAASLPEAVDLAVEEYKKYLATIYGPELDEPMLTAFKNELLSTPPAQSESRAFVIHGSE